jgi:predicted phosphodiesterase
VRRKYSAHEIVADYLRVSDALGQPPSRDQYQADPQCKFSKRQIIETFGSWINLVRASVYGLSPLARERRPDKQELRKLYYEHLVKEAERLRTEVIEHPPAKRLLVIADIHAPYEHPDYIAFIIKLHAKHSFDRVCLTGDEVDHHAISFHDKDPSLPSAGYELEAAIKSLEPLYEAFPVADVAESNHGSLVYRKGKHHGIPRQVLKPYHEQLRAPPGWRWQTEIKVPLSNGESCLIHHSYSSNILLDSQRKSSSLICGHHHNKLSVEHWHNGEKQFFAAFAGSGVDDKSLAMAYNKNIVLRPQLGCVIVIDGQAFTVRMNLNKNGRWDGVV